MKSSPQSLAKPVHEEKLEGRLVIFAYEHIFRYNMKKYFLIKFDSKITLYTSLYLY